MFNKESDAKENEKKPSKKEAKLIVHQTREANNGIYYSNVSPTSSVSPYSDDPIDKIKAAYARFEKSLAGEL